MNHADIVAELFRLQDKEYGTFQSKLIPSVSAERVIGVRTPELRALAKRLYQDGQQGGACGAELEAFLASLPHAYFEEDQLHAFVISLEKDFDRCVARVEAFLPFIDNWATCDQLSPKAFKKTPERLLPYIERWIRSDKTYTIRFAIKMLMEHFLDDKFETKYADMVAAVRSKEYYVNMMIAWYFATALAKQYEAVLPYLEEKRLDAWVHNKAIQKSIESYRITAEQKAALRSLKIKQKLHE